MSYFDPNALKEAPTNALEDYAKTSPAPAALIEVARGGLSVSNATGTVTLGGDQAATTENRFEIGSQTKMMTSVIILQLVAEGGIDIDAPLADQMDLTGLEGIANIQEVTVRELLANRSGIPDFDSVMGETGNPVFIEQLLLNPGEALGPDEALAIASGEPASFAPGEAYEYSNTNFLLLQKLMEQVTGQSFSELLSERIFVPCGMDDSALKSAGDLEGILHSYGELSAGQPLDVTEIPIDLGAAGGVVSTTSDMIRFLDALLVSRTLLPPEQMEEMLDFRAPDGTPSVEDGESFGLSSGVVFGEQFVGFQGGTLGTNTATFVHPASGTIVSIAASHSQSEVADLMINAFAAIFNDDAWANFDPSDDSVTIAGTAAEIMLSEDVDVSGNPETVLELNGASLRFEGGLGDLDTEKFSFADGSTFWIAEQGGDRFDVLRDAADASGKDNQLIGLDGHDNLRGGHGNDKIIGGSGNDRLAGRDGDDRLDGGAGRDYLNGGRGDDVLSGDDGADILRGGAGNDILEGGAGADHMIGGGGADVFVFGSESGSDKIYDFNTDQDRLDFSQTGMTFDDLQITSYGAFTRVSYGDAELYIFATSCEPLTEDVFIF